MILKVHTLDENYRIKKDESTSVLDRIRRIMIFNDTPSGRRDFFELLRHNILGQTPYPVEVKFNYVNSHGRIVTFQNYVTAENLTTVKKYVDSSVSRLAVYNIACEKELTD